jgi:signal peptidase I
MNDKKTGNEGQNPLLRLVLAPVRAVAWLIGWDADGAGSWVGTIKTIIYAVLIAMGVRTFFYEPFNIPSGSMKPTLLVGDYLFVSKFSYGYSRYSLGFGLDVPIFDGRLFGSEPDRGDVVVFRKPTDTSLDFIKRLVGLPGDTIQVIDGVLNINGEPVTLEPAPPFDDETCGGGRELMVETEILPNGVRHPVLGSDTRHSFDNTPVYTVPEGHYFMMGDNRDHSNDSRAITDVGFVPAENLIGRAEFLFFSTDGCGSLYEPWTWPTSIRWSRLFQPIE